MKNKILALTITCLVSFYSGYSQVVPERENNKNDEASNVQSPAKEYEDLLAKLKNGDTKIDFVKLRLAYTDTKDYRPYGGGQERNEMFKALNVKKYREALKLAEKMLETNFVDLHSHYVAIVSSRELKENQKSLFHEEVFDGLMNAILQNDGLTAKTAIISIGISEQYFIMNYLGFRPQSKALIRENGSIFDVHSAYNEKTQESRKFYFNIDKVFGRF